VRRVRVTAPGGPDSRLFTPNAELQFEAALPQVARGVDLAVSDLAGFKSESTTLRILMAVPA